VAVKKMITFSDSRTAVRAEERQNHHEPLQKKRLNLQVGDLA